MKRLLALALAATLVVAAVAFSGGQRPGGGGSTLNIQVEERNPWTHLRLNNNSDEFRFAVVSDRTGGHRARIFSQAVERLNLMQPEFVVCVGDLIEGYSKDTKKLSDEWKEIQGYVNKLQMPFFYVPGNHDVTNPVQVKDWEGRFGRRYYHFIYRDVLFLMLDSEDPPEKGGGYLSAEQAKFAEKILKENPGVRWTLVFIHKPLWNMASPGKNGWEKVEKALDGRKYTVFCGHVHRYQKFVRNGMNYYQLATTGGSSKVRGVRYGEFDHLVWMTMKKEGPVMANVLLDGVFPENLDGLITDETGRSEKRKATEPVRGKILFDGKPADDAEIAFHQIGDKKKAAKVGDALTETNGTFVMTTYLANDGLPAGEYVVTVVRRDPPRDVFGKSGPNRLPTVYSRAETTPLRATVRSGSNEFTFNLQKMPEDDGQ